MGYLCGGAKCFSVCFYIHTYCALLRIFFLFFLFLFWDCLSCNAFSAECVDPGGGRDPEREAGVNVNGQNGTGFLALSLLGAGDSRGCIEMGEMETT